MYHGTGGQQKQADDRQDGGEQRKNEGKVAHVLQLRHECHEQGRAENQHSPRYHP